MTENAQKTVAWSAFGAIAAVIIAGIALTNSINGPAVAIGRLEQSSALHGQEISEIRRDMRSSRRGQERVLIVLTALAKANGITVPKRSQMP